MSSNAKRRRASVRKKEEAGSGGGRIFLQTILCIVIIFYVLFGGTHELPIGQTVLSFTKDTVARNTDLSSWFSLLRGEVEKRLGSPDIPDNAEEESFTENTSAEAAETAAFSEQNENLQNGGES